MTPFLAQGAAQAIEDADALARRLGAVDRRRRVARRLFGDRVARAARVQRDALAQGRVYHLSGPLALARDLAMRASDPSACSSATTGSTRLSPYVLSGPRAAAAVPA